MKIKSGNKVIVITGKDKGKIGKVLRAIPRKDFVIVDGVNVAKKHRKAKRSNEKGQVVEKAMPVHVSNVALVDSKAGKRIKK